VANNEVGGCGNTAAITTIPEMNSEHGALPYRRRWVIVRAASGAQGVAVHPRFWRGKNPRTTQVGFSDPPVVGNCGGVWTPESREMLAVVYCESGRCLEVPHDKSHR